LSSGSSNQCNHCADARSIRERKWRYGVLAERYPAYQADHFDEADIDIQADADFFAQLVQD